MSRNRNDGLLARVDFPLYTLQTLTNRHVIVAGGGGSSNTGVANGFEIFELSHNGTRFVAEEVMRHETGPNVVMTCSVQSFQNKTYLTAGQESHCQLYKINMKMVDAAEMRRGSFRAENGLVRRRRRTVSENDNISKTDSNSNTTEKRISFEIRPCDSVQTDFGDDPLLRVVRISNNGKLMATGGIDGKVRIWSFPKMELLHVLEGHTKELDDLDFSPCDKHLVSIAKDGLALVWATDGTKEPQLTLTCQPVKRDEIPVQKMQVRAGGGVRRGRGVPHVQHRQPGGAARAAARRAAGVVGGGRAARRPRRARAAVRAGRARRRPLRRRGRHVQRLRRHLRRLQPAARAARGGRAPHVRDGAAVPAHARVRPARAQPQRGRAALHLRGQLRARAQPAAARYHSCVGCRHTDCVCTVLYVLVLFLHGHLAICKYLPYFRYCICV
ncbi:hypothetical protein ACJJTC_016719 [Scirpophaga incertulas]